MEWQSQKMIWKSLMNKWCSTSCNMTKKGLCNFQGLGWGLFPVRKPNQEKILSASNAASPEKWAWVKNQCCTMAIILLPTSTYYGKNVLELHSERNILTFISLFLPGSLSFLAQVKDQHLPSLAGIWAQSRHKGTGYRCPMPESRII